MLCNHVVCIVSGLANCYPWRGVRWRRGEGGLSCIWLLMRWEKHLLVRLPVRKRRCKRARVGSASKGAAAKGPGDEYVDSDDLSATRYKDVLALLPDVAKPHAGQFKGKHNYTLTMDSKRGRIQVQCSA